MSCSGCKRASHKELSKSEKRIPVLSSKEAVRVRCCVRKRADNRGGRPVGIRIDANRTMFAAHTDGKTFRSACRRNRTLWFGLHYFDQEAALG